MPKERKIHLSVIKTKTLDRNIIFISAPEITSGDENNNTIAILLDSSWMIQDAEYFITFFTTDEEDGIIKKLDVQDRLCVCSVPDKAVKNEGSFYFGLFAKAPDGTVKTSAIASYAVRKGIITDSQGEDTLSMLAMKNKFIDLINSNTYDTLLSPEMDFDNEIDPTFTNYMSNLHLADYKYTSIVDSLFEIIKKFIDTDAEKIDDPDFAPLIYYLIVYEYVKNASSQVSSDSAGDDLDPISSPNQELLTSLQEDVSAALSNLNALANRVYSYTHSAVVTDDLEKDYQDIITANPDLANVSAVGLLAILSDGGTVTAQGNRMFINGTEEQTDYSFSGENSQNGIEFIKVWFFENNGSLSPKKPDGIVTKIISKTKSATPDLSNDFFDYVNEIAYDTIPAKAPIAVEKQHNLSTVSGSDFVSAAVKEYSCNAANLSSVYTALINNTSVKKVSFPFLTKIDTPPNYFNSARFFSGCTNLEDFDFPSLSRIENTLIAATCPFYGVKSLTLPESVSYVGKWTINAAGKVHLKCKDAEFNNDWFYQNPPSRFTMCSDWGASINISKIAVNAWMLSDYIDLMTNKLRDMTATEETRTLTIPSAMLTSLQADTDGLAAIEAATDKGWTIGGA